MVKVDGRYFNENLKKNLDLLSKAVDLNNDGVIYISGYEGAAKTTFGSQICWYLDRTFCLDRVVFNAEQFVDACTKARPKQAILFDESYMSFTNRSVHNRTSKILVSMLTMIRKKQLYLVIVAPTFFDIQKYIAIHRSRALLHVYTRGLERGYFKFYNRKKKLELYMKGKKYNDMGCVMPNFDGRFTKWLAVDEEKYDQKKEEAIQDFRELIKKPPIKSEEDLRREKLNNQDEVILWLRSNKLLKNGAMVRLAENFFNITSAGLTKRLGNRLREVKA